MKTPMQELMDSFDAYQNESQSESIAIDKTKEVITNNFLEKEKQVIYNFCVDNYNETLSFENWIATYYS